MEKTGAMEKTGTAATTGTLFEELETVRLAYRERGDGPVLILLHGNSGSKNTFRKYRDTYFRDYRTYAIDSRGHGESVSDDESLSIERMSEDVIAFCRKKGIASAAVIGYSDGGNIALFLAKKAPELFPKVVAVSPNYLVSGTGAKTLKTIVAFRRLFGFLDRLGFRMKKWIMRFELMLNDIGLSQEDLRNIGTSVHIVYAEHDMITEDHILEMHSLIPNSTVYKVPGATHINELGKPDAIRNIREYLAGK